MSKLKKCPFCKNKKIKYFSGWKFDDRNKDDRCSRQPSICCMTCGIGFTIGSFDRGISDNQAKIKTYNKWNMRYKIN